MLYFIPAWYHQNQWCENEQKWYRRRAYTEFDDTVKQIQLFHRKGTDPYEILLLAYSPNFRHFLHRQGVYHAPYWSCFDAIQEVERKKAGILSYHSLNWPDGIEFIYTPFCVVAFLHGEQYAKVEFGEDGNPIQVDLYQKGKLCRRNYYDDRGFVSSSVVLEQDKPVYQDFLMENGMRKMRYFSEDGHVEIHPARPQYRICRGGRESLRTFSKLKYESLEEVITEVFQSYLEELSETEIFCAAMHARHSGVLQKTLKGRKLILSFFGERYPLVKSEQDAQLIRSADYVVTDSFSRSEKLKKQLSFELLGLTDIPPYDTREDQGISQQLRVQNILVPVDGLPEEKLEQIILLLKQYLEINQIARVCLFTKVSRYGRDQELMNLTAGIVNREAEPEAEADEEDLIADKTERASEENSILERFSAEQCVTELEISRCMKKQRILVDLREVPDLYLQILAVSIGIPQITTLENHFVKHEGNGYVIREEAELLKALEYYLDGMKNWNAAQIHSYEIGKEYQAEVLLDKWKEVIRYAEKSTCASSGEKRSI